MTPDTVQSVLTAHTALGALLTLTGRPVGEGSGRTVAQAGLLGGQEVICETEYQYHFGSRGLESVPAALSLDRRALIQPPPGQLQAWLWAL